jgi:mono/diheme cytochrome c family protein
MSEQRKVRREQRAGLHERRTTRAPFLAVLALIAGGACTDAADDPLGPSPDGASRNGRARLPPKGVDPPPTGPAMLNLGPTVTLDRAPPSLGGASVIVSKDDRLAIASDPDRDRVVIVNIATREVREVPLTLGDEPGRLALDAAGRVHVVLDGSGDVATIDLATAQVLARRPVCAAPRGITFGGEQLFVACTGGELVVLPSDPSGAESRLLARIDRDLRDVVMIGADLLVSRLRSAEVLRVRAEDGVVLARAAPPTSGSVAPFVGWRLVKRGVSSTVSLVHQLAQPDVAEQSGGYGSSNSCDGPVVSAITSFTPSELGLAVHSEINGRCDAVLPVDAARSTKNHRWAVVSAGNLGGTGRRQIVDSKDEVIAGSNDLKLHIVAVAVTTDDRLVTFSREPALLRVSTMSWSTFDEIPLGGESRTDTGHIIFHLNSGESISCASCHPGGEDDGRVWPFAKGKRRRTQPLAGMLEGTAPYHWGGDMASVEAFGSMVFTDLMHGPNLADDQRTAMSTYLKRLPLRRVSPPHDALATARGKALFESANVGCASCHSSPRTTNNAFANVGTGGAFQVPSLSGVAVRAPYLHDGRATTLRDSFATAQHGNAAVLSPGESSDLITYVESL